MRPALLGSVRERQRGAGAASSAAVALEALARVEQEAPGALQDMVATMLSNLSVDPGLALGSGGGLVPGPGPEPRDLGPLGTYLLARWRRGLAREHLHGAFLDRPT